MQDKILLGFLMSGPRTGYQIKRMMEMSTDFFFSTSFGSIYPAFASLEKKGLVRGEEAVERGKAKKTYTITAEGQSAFINWLREAPGISRIRDEALLKIFFHSRLDGPERTAQIRDYGELLEAEARKLEKIREKLAGRPVDPFNLMTLDFGIDYYRWVRQRCLRMADEIEKINTGDTNEDSRS